MFLVGHWHFIDSWNIIYPTLNEMFSALKNISYIFFSFIYLFENQHYREKEKKERKKEKKIEEKDFCIFHPLNLHMATVSWYLEMAILKPWTRSFLWNCFLGTNWSSQDTNSCPQGMLILQGTISTHWTPRLTQISCI